MTAATCDSLRIAQRVSSSKRRPLLSSSGPAVAIYSVSLRFFFRARFCAKACFTRFFWPGFR
jgi:hypothetical protein